MRMEAVGGVVTAMRIAVVMGGVLIAAAPNAAAQSNTAAIDVRGNAFIPSPITVLVGTTVTWTQRDTIEHTVTVDDNQPEDWQHGILLPMNAAGALNEFEHTFQNLGTTSYHCEVHTNMIGEVIVVESFHSPFVTVNANDANEFSPEQVQTNVTDGVLWINSGTLQHTVTFEDSSIGDLGVIDEGEPIRFNFTAPGSYRYRCTYHSGNDFETGMVGKVVVGGNASFPTVLLIEEPSENATVNDTLNVTGRLIQGEGQAAVTDLEYRLDENTNWTDINTTDLKEFRWAFSVDITNLVLGIHTIQVRALAGESEVASDSRTVVIEAAPPPHRAGEGNGSASPSLLLVLVALLAFVVVERNRRSR